MNSSELKRLLNGKQREEQNKILKDAYKGEKCIVFSCGPSLISREEYDKHIAGKGYRVATVKQAFYRMNDQVDFQFFNCNNFTLYKPKNPNTLFFSAAVAGLNQTKSSTWGEQEIDIFDRIHPEYAGKQDKTIAELKNFDDWKFDREILRPWGPGIVYETVLFHLLHMGFKEIIINGFDLGKPNTGLRELKHFYNEDGQAGGLNFFKNKAAKCYNGEIDAMVGVSYGFFKSITESGAKCRILSDVSYVDERIPRIKLEGL